MALNTRSPRSGKIKIALLVTAFCIVFPILFYTHNLVNELQHKEHEVARLYARSMEYLANSPYSGVDYSFVFNEMILAIDFPVIETDVHDTEIRAYRNVDVDSTLAPSERDNILRTLVRNMDASNRPITVTYQDTIVLSRVHYGESPLITRLRWLPYIEIIVGSLFVLIGYIGFSYIKRSEQSNIWVGMARETAHQLGTPLSSLMGWIEMLKLQSDAAPRIGETIGEMEHDLKRLGKIAERFSKIGSKTDLREEDLTAVIDGVISYFRKRLPQMGKRVRITIDPSAAIAVNINRELFEWVLENLVKNALDAMEEGNGNISFHVEKTGKNVYIDVSDTGKGIESKYQKDIFRPGFTTKKRGWGLGLSLSKRIIENYHRGKVFVKESSPGHGTTFRIKLRAL
jgi:signal transduction histidine kinase